VLHQLAWHQLLELLHQRLELLVLLLELQLLELLVLQLLVLVQVLELLLFYRKQPEQRPTKLRSTEFFS